MHHRHVVIFRANTHSATVQSIYYHTKIFHLCFCHRHGRCFHFARNPLNSECWQVRFNQLVLILNFWCGSMQIGWTVTLDVRNMMMHRYK